MLFDIKENIFQVSWIYNSNKSKVSQTLLFFERCCFPFHSSWFKNTNKLDCKLNSEDASCSYMITYQSHKNKTKIHSTIPKSVKLQWLLSKVNEMVKPVGRNQYRSFCRVSPTTNSVLTLHSWIYSESLRWSISKLKLKLTSK